MWRAASSCRLSDSGDAAAPAHLLLSRAAVTSPRQADRLWHTRGLPSLIYRPCGLSQEELAEPHSRL